MKSSENARIISSLFMMNHYLWRKPEQTTDHIISALSVDVELIMTFHFLSYKNRYGSVLGDLMYVLRSYVHYTGNSTHNNTHKTWTLTEKTQWTRSCLVSDSVCDLQGKKVWPRIINITSCVKMNFQEYLVYNWPLVLEAWPVNILCI